jgi:hypothetical protein
MAVPAITHVLSIQAKTPKEVTEGKQFDIEYIVTNAGNTVFPGGAIMVQINWPSLAGINVGVTIDINRPLQPTETFTQKMKETALATGYTLFTVRFGTVINRGSLDVRLPDGRTLWPTPLQQIGMSQLFHAVRAKSQEEISQRNALWAAITAVVVTAVFSIIDVVLRFFFKF